MNAVEIEEAVSDLVLQPFDADEFPFQFLAAFGNKDTTIKRLRTGTTNQSDVDDGLLQRNNIHMAVASAGCVGETLAALRGSPKTASAKAKFILATDGETVEAEDLVGGDVIACAYADLPRHFAIFLPLAGISTVREIKNNPIDVKATGRLNKLYVELLKDNPNWATEDRRHELNQFMARLIFCFFAEDTGIFRENQFTATITQMSHAGHGSGEAQWGNTHLVLTELFRAMDTPVMHDGNLDPRYRQAANIRPYADVFPYVNGGLFTGATQSPRFSRTARAYLLRAGELDWREINPDIFGSMIQAVAEDDERGELGMHYTSVPNILKVLNPLFLDELREHLEAAGDSKQKLRNLRRRLGNIRVFDPACGSGNFLVIAYKEMRAIEAQIVEQLGGEANLKLAERRSVIPLSNFYGIEVKSFAGEIARLALLIAEFQADCLYLSQQEARAMVLPLHKTGQITVGNALRVDWLEVCEPARTVATAEHDLAGPTGRLALEENALQRDGVTETYICGNPPYSGYNKQSASQKSDLELVFSPLMKRWGNLDYVAGWFVKAAQYLTVIGGAAAFVSTNTICQGGQVPILWPTILGLGQKIVFAHTSFKWANLAAHNAGITVIIVGIAPASLAPTTVTLFEEGDDGVTARSVLNINGYLAAARDIFVHTSASPISDIAKMNFGNHPYYGAALIFSRQDAREMIEVDQRSAEFIRPYYGSTEVIYAAPRMCVWVREPDASRASKIKYLKRRFDAVYADRAAKPNDSTAVTLAETPYRFRDQVESSQYFIAVPQTSSENRPYLPCDVITAPAVVSFKCFAIHDAPLWNLALVASRLHWAWIGTVCARMRTDFSYSNTLGWNTFPVPKLTEQDKLSLTRSAENILLAREAHFPGTIADLYNPESMPDDLRRAHEENDELLERIYIGRRFRNDTERLEKLFDLYTKMTARLKKPGKGRRAA